MNTRRPDTWAFTGAPREIRPDRLKRKAKASQKPKSEGSIPRKAGRGKVKR